LRTFARLVAEKGYAETSIGEVAGELQLSKGTVVHHFGSKVQILRAVHDDYMQRRLDEAHHILSEAALPTEQLTGIIYALLASHRDDRDASLAFLREFSRFTTDPHLAGVRAQRNTYTSLVRGIVQRGVDGGEFQAGDVTVCTLGIVGMCNYAWTWYRPNGRLSIDDIATEFVRNALNGLLTAEVPEDELRKRVAAASAVVLSAPGRKPPPVLVAPATTQPKAIAVT
jgi:AcrR family transcriptional regulator